MEIRTCLIFSHKTHQIVSNKYDTHVRGFEWTR
jgi:hypothetical protein